jgi:hypothetical protein
MKLNIERYTGTDVCNIFNIEKPRYREMTLRKFIVATYPAKSQGMTAFYNRSDLYDIGLFMHLIDERKFTREAASWFVKNLREDPEDIYWLGKTDRHSSDTIWFIIGGTRYSIYLVDRTEADMLTMHEKTRPYKEDEDQISEQRYFQEGIRREYDDIIIVNTKRIRQHVDEAIKTL